MSSHLRFTVVFLRQCSNFSSISTAHVYVHACVCTYVFVCAHTCIYACMHAYVCVYVGFYTGFIVGGEQITDDNLTRLMRIAIEGPELTVVDFDNFRRLQRNESYYIVN